MNPEPPKYGRTESAPIRLLESAEFDFHDGQSPPTNLGQTDTSVNILSDWLIDGTELDVTPALVLKFHIRPDAKSSTVTFDLFTAFAVLNRYEISLGGRGLVPDEARSDLAVMGGTLRLVLTATEPAGAADRLAKLAIAVNSSDAAVIEGKFALRSFGGCEAAVGTAA